jgi:hypothetical protein
MLWNAVKLNVLRMPKECEVLIFVVMNFLSIERGKEGIERFWGKIAWARGDENGNLLV